MLFGEECTLEDTAKSAANSKWSASSKGYYKDPFVEHFLDFKHVQLPHQNLGSYIRTESTLRVLRQFHLEHNDGQVVILGCGFDTMYWLMKAENINFNGWLEVDQESVVNEKRKLIQKEIFQPLTGYYLDICNLDYFDEFSSIFNKYLSPNLPTLFIDEFTLLYCKEETALFYRKFAARSPQNCFYYFGMTFFDDDFGDLVASNFEKMGIPLQSHALTETPEKSNSVMISCGFEDSFSIRSDHALKAFFNQEQLFRISRLELFDDPKQLKYILKHYLSSAAGSKSFVQCLK